MLADNAPVMVTIEEVRHDPEVVVYIQSANSMMHALGYTEHGERHASLVANIANIILQRLGYSEHLADLAAIAGYMHDMGNLVLREGHPQTSAILARLVLGRLGMSLEDMALVMGAVGNHEEPYGVAVNPIAAAVIIADKSDVHSSRVQTTDPKTFDIHDRVNYAVLRSFVRVDGAAKTITLEIEIDTTGSSVQEYFEIFLTRMVMCRRAAQFLGCRFSLVINGNTMM